MFFEYKAKDKDNRLVKGMVEAESETAASEVLREKGLIIIALTERKGGWTAGLQFLNRVKAKDLVIFSRQLSVLIASTVPIVQALRVLVKQTENVVLQSIISEIADEVEGGVKLSSALGKHPKIFSNFFINMIKSGETSGRLDEVLNYLADQQEKDYDLMSKVRGAMIYPVFILSGLLVVGIVMMVFVVPKLTEMLRESGAELPLTTRLLIGTSDFMVDYWWALIIMVGAFIGAVILYKKTPVGKKQWDYLKLKIPIFGSLFQKIYLVRITRSLSTLLKGGITVSSSLNVVAEVVGNVIYKDLVLKTVKEVEDGNSITVLFSQSRVVPQMMSQMLSIGEQTGKLDQILEKLAAFYSREIDNLVRNLVTLIEPMIMILMGVAVGMMVSAIILPMYKLASQF